MATQVEILMRTEGGPAAATAAGGAPSGDQKEAAKKEKAADERSNEEQGAFADLKKKMNDKLGGAKKFFSKNLGIQFGLSSILKQSQVFTSFIGTIFQLVGALVDVILAPLLPLFFPLVRMLASAIPQAQKFGEWLGAKLVGWFDGIRAWYQSIKPLIDEKVKEFKDAWAGGWTEVAKLIWDWTWQGLQWAWTKLWTVGLPWVWEKIKGLGAWAWEQFKQFGTDTKAKIITFGLYLWHTVYTKFKGWVAWFKNLTPEAKALFKAQVLKVTKLILNAPFKVFGFGLKIAGFLLKMLLPGIGHILVGITKVGGFIVKGIMKAAVGIIKFAFKWIFKGIGFLVSRSVAAGKGVLAGLLKRVTDALSGMKFFGGAFKKLGGALGYLKVAAKASKAIPVLGAVATVGFGIAETVQNTQKYGWKAGLATAGKTALAAGLAAGGQTYASLAVDVGGGIAIKKMAQAGVFGQSGSHFQAGGAGAPQIVVKNTIVTQDGTPVQESTVTALAGQEEVKSDLSAALQAAGGSPS